VTENFSTIAVCDTEYETSGGEFNLRPGDLPVPLCLVAYILDENLNHVRTIKLWREQLLTSKHPPFCWWVREVLQRARILGIKSGLGRHGRLAGD
jgi:hypothetical protein